MKNIIFILSVSVLLASCQSTKDAFTLKKKDQIDEFLVEKKNPLVLPPEYGKLPAPQDGQIKSDEIKNEENKIFVNNEINDLPSTVEVIGNSISFCFALCFIAIQPEARPMTLLLIFLDQTSLIAEGGAKIICPFNNLILSLST